MNRASQIILYVFAGIVAFVFFMVLLFPLDTVIGHYLAKIEQETKGKYRVVVSEINSSLIFDTEFKDFRVFENGKELLAVPSLDVGFSLFSLLGDSTDISFDANYKKGEISGRVAFSIAGTNISLEVIDLNFDDVALSEFKFMDRYLTTKDFSIKLDGKVNGSIYVLLDTDIKNSEAEIELAFSDLKTGAIPIKMLQQQIPEMVMSDDQKAFVIEANLANSTLTLTKFSVPGPDFKMEATGNARLNRRYEMVRLSLDGKFSFSEKVSEEFTLVSLLSSSQGPDGSYPLTARGSWDSPKITVGDLQLTDLIKF